MSTPYTDRDLDGNIIFLSPCPMEFALLYIQPTALTLDDCIDNDRSVYLIRATEKHCESSNIQETKFHLVGHETWSLGYLSQQVNLISTWWVCYDVTDRCMGQKIIILHRFCEESRQDSRKRCAPYVTEFVYIKHGGNWKNMIEMMLVSI